MGNKYFDTLTNNVKKGKDVYIAPGAFVLGDVELGDNVSIWYNAVIRADHDKVTIGERTNVQDGVVMHVDHGVPITIGTDNVIGHNAIIHGCTLGDNNLIGMGCTIMNNVKIGNCCVIGANTLIKENMEIPDYSMVVGVPGKIIKQLPEGVKDMIQLGVAEYMNEAQKYLNDQ